MEIDISKIGKVLD